MSKPIKHVESKTKSPARGVLFTALSALCFATAGVLIKLIPWGTLSISAGRSIFGLVVMYLLLRARGNRMRINGPIIVAGLFNYAMMQTFILANKMTTAANAIVLQFTMPIWLILFLWILFKKKPTRVEIIASVVVFLGMILFFLDQLSPTGFAGNLVAIASGAFYAGVFVSKRYPGCDFDVAAIIGLALCVLTGIPSILGEVDFSPQVLLFVALLGIVQQGGGYLFLSLGMDHINAVPAAITSMLEPIANAVMVAIILGELMGPSAMLGSAVVLGTTLAYNIISAKQSSND